MKQIRTLSLLFFIAIVAIVLISVEAAGTRGAAGPVPVCAEKADYTAGKAAADAGDYHRAVELMSKVVATELQPTRDESRLQLSQAWRLPRVT